VLFLFDSTPKQVSFGLFDLLVSLALKPVSFDRWNEFCRSFRRCGIVLVSFDTPTGLFCEMCWSFSIFQTSAMLPRTATHTETHCNTLNVLVAIDASGVRLAFVANLRGRYLCGKTCNCLPFLNLGHIEFLNAQCNCGAGCRWVSRRQISVLQCLCSRTAC